jgi:hypothetical protein
MSGSTQKLDRGSLAVGISSAIFGITSLYGMYLLSRSQPALFPFSWKSFTPTPFITAMIALWFIGAAFVTIFGVAGSAIVLIEGQGPRRIIFPLPAHLRRKPGWLPNELFTDDRATKPKPPPEK